MGTWILILDSGDICHDVWTFVWGNGLLFILSHCVSEFLFSFASCELPLRRVRVLLGLPISTSLGTSSSIALTCTSSHEGQSTARSLIKAKLVMELGGTWRTLGLALCGLALA